MPKKLTFKEVKTYVEITNKEGYELISDEYINPKIN